MFVCVVNSLGNNLFLQLVCFISLSFLTCSDHISVNGNIITGNAFMLMRNSKLCYKCSPEVWLL